MTEMVSCTSTRISNAPLSDIESSVIFKKCLLKESLSFHSNDRTCALRAHLLRLYILT